jgi:uncharacterized protein
VPENSAIYTYSRFLPTLERDTQKETELDVTVAVLASPKDAQFLTNILSCFARAGIDAYGLKLHDTWESLQGDSVLRRLEKASHFLALASGSSLGASWFPFAAGYGYSRGTPLALYRFDPDREIPRYLSGLPVLDSLEELESYYRTEMGTWLAEEERRASRASLLEMGISCHDDSLAHCASEGDTKAVELFLKAGFSPDARDKHGVPLLCLAARGKHRSVAELLLDKGASVDMQSEDRGYSPLMDASHIGSADLVALFIERGADPDLKSKDGQTALVVAVGRNDVETARLLLAGGADPDLADKLGLSARKYGALFKNPSMLALFEKRE